jgi:hypothetical protein
MESKNLVADLFKNGHAPTPADSSLFEKLYSRLPVKSVEAVDELCKLLRTQESFMAFMVN